MGEKKASLHFRCDIPEEIIPLLKREFSQKKEPSQSELSVLQSLGAIVQHGIDSIVNPKEKAEQEKLWAEGQLEIQRMYHDEYNRKALIIIRKKFISLYWGDRLRSDNLSDMAYDFAKKTKVPVLGVAVYDSSNFIIQAMRVFGEDTEECEGSYWFDSEDIKPVEASEVCRILNADFLTDALEKTLSCSGGIEMAETFEQSTGLPIFQDADMCRQDGMNMVEELEGADFFS